MERRVTNQRDGLILSFSHGDVPHSGSNLTIKNKRYRVVGLEYNYDTNLIIIKVIKL